ncbi:DUF2637 domain-containing protein [Kitasatospora sp. NPDC059571]|uniref:DUF2637 domain-containing protein n=1 Tax=Kitasatospora sp. NPDC059571 TaxID=3346871 RepID=UPI00369A3360
MSRRPSLTRAHRALLGVVAAGACLISGIGFAGSYNAVRELAMQKGFGAFSYAFPIGVDAGIVVLLSLDLVLTWLRIPFPLLRQTAWLLTAATIAFNAAASWGDALGMAMHAVIPVLFVVVVEASRHAVGRIAAITADRHMESVRLMRWLLSPVPTFRLWRRMKLWELRSYDETVRLEQNRLVYRAQLRFRYGRGWRRSAPFQALLPLKLAKYGVPLDPSVLDRIDGPLEVTNGESAPAVAQVSAAVAVPTLAKLAAVRLRDSQEGAHEEAPEPEREAASLNVWMTRAVRSYSQQADDADAQPGRLPGQSSPWFKPPRAAGVGPEGVAASGPVRSVQQAPVRGAGAQQGRRPGVQSAGPARDQGVTYQAPGRIGRPVRLEQTVQAEAEPESYRDEVQRQGGGYRQQAAGLAGRGRDGGRADEQLPLDALDAELDAEFQGEFEDGFESGRDAAGRGRLAGGPALDADACFDALISYIDSYATHPDPQHLAEYLTHQMGMTGSRPDGSVNAADLEKIWPDLQQRYVATGRD